MIEQTYKTFTSATPRRISATHYQIPSLSSARKGVVYNLRNKRDPKSGRTYWQCDCYDAQKNPNCKHVRRLGEWIAEMKAQGLDGEQAAAIAAAEYHLLKEQEDKVNQAAAIIEQELRLQEMEMQRDAAATQVGELLRQMCQLIDEQQARIAELEKAVGTLTAKRQETKTQAQLEREAWEEFERDPVAGRRKQAEARRMAEEARKRENAPLNNRNAGFNLYR